MTTVDVRSGAEAWTRLNEEQFGREWLILFRSCQWATPFQTADFVLTWFKAYRKQYRPVLFEGRNAARQLTGLMILACPPDGHEYVAPGAHQAEYQCWLSMGSEWDAFLRMSFAALHRIDPHARVRFKYLPSRLFDAGDGQRFEERVPRVMVRELPCPLADLRKEKNNIISSLKKKNNKWRLNRLKRLGELRLIDNLQGDAGIQELGGFVEVLDWIITYYDVRQGAINGVRPFHDDHAKRGFHLDLYQASDCLKVFCLVLDDEIIAAMIGVAGNRRISNAILCHAPRLAQYSPGKYLLGLLARRVLEAGYEVLDLTPGGEWKERFANSSESVADVTVFTNRGDWCAAVARRQIEIWAKAALRTVRLKPSVVRDLVRRLSRLTPRRVANRARTLLQRLSSTELRIYRFSASDARALPHERSFNRDNLSDLVAFEPSESWHTTESFLTKALGYLGEGMHSYTFVANGLFVHSGWLVPRQEKAFFSEVDRSYKYPPGTAVLFDFYTHPKARGMGLYQRALRQMLRDAAEIDGTKWIYISVLADNGPSRHVIEKIGFNYVESVFA